MKILYVQVANTLDFGKFISGSLLSSNCQIIFCNCETSSSHHKMKKMNPFLLEEWFVEYHENLKVPYAWLNSLPLINLFAIVDILARSGSKYSVIMFLKVK